MALRINLLPEYVRLRRVFKRIAAICAAVFGLVALILFLVYYKRQQELATLQANLDVIEPIAVQAEQALTQTTTITTAAAPKRSAVDFVVAASKSGPERAVLLDVVSDYIYGRVQISSLDLSDGQTVRIRASLDNPDEYYRFLDNLRRGAQQEGGPLFSALPVASGVPGFPPPPPPAAGGAQNQAAGGPPGGPPGPAAPNQSGAKVFPLTVDAIGPLRYPVQLAPDPGGAPAGAAPAGGEPGGPPGGPPPGAP